jgi:sugar lactone lactonase YvrE
MPIPPSRQSKQARCAGRLAIRVALYPAVLVCLGIWGLFGAAPARAAEPLKSRCVRAWGVKGDKPGEFYSPIGVALNARDEVIVTDLNNSRVQIFSNEGVYTGGFDLPRDTPERKSSQAGGVAVDRDGLIYVTFMMQDKVRVYTQSGELVREWGERGAKEGQLFAPGGIAITPDRHAWVCDQRNHRMQKFTLDGKFVLAWGEHGQAPGQFDGVEPAGSRFGGPHFVDLDGMGRLYTTEGALTRVQQLSPEGKPLLAWGSKGDEPGAFGAHQFSSLKNTLGPIGIRIDRFDRVYVSSLNDRVQVFSTEGKFLFLVGDSGQDRGEFARPHGMAFDSRDRLYVADAGNQRIQVFEIPPP